VPGNVTSGPFEMTVVQVEALDLRFTPFVNRLLDIERRAAGLSAHLLTITKLETVGDGGVDAATRDARATDWIPRGDTAWQFKRSDLTPKKCEDELRDAVWAHEFLRNGGSYVLVLGKGLTDKKVEDRRQRLLSVAIELGLLLADDRSRLRIYDANKLARWASEHPSLAVSRLAGGPGNVAIDHAEWSNRRPHKRTWTPDKKRTDAIASLRATIKTVGVVDVRVQGESGIGKTRLILEALRDEELSPLVAYVDNAAEVSGELLRHLLGAARSVILVVDECSAELHAKLTDRLPAETSSKLITVGQEGPAVTPTPIVGLESMPTDDVEQFLKVNFPNLGSEARRFVAAHSRGNLRWTIVLAERVPEIDQAAELITRNDITAFIEAVLPEGRDFFCSAALALLSRVGWEREVRYQLEIMASFSGRTVAELEAVAQDLQGRGVLARHGRFCAIEPHPLAVFLAAEAWRKDAARIVGDLLPKLDEGMALALFERVADLGRFEPAQSVLSNLLSGDGPFATLDRIDETGAGRLLTQLAIVLPQQVALHLSEQIEALSLEGLKAHTRLRRDLVWTLEKLAWHRATFEVAGNALLRLAVAETETYANNATGTWVALFGTMLPATAATPIERIGYLRSIATNPNVEVRKLTIAGASHALIRLEGITVSAELQGGVLVEPRGTPKTYAEAYQYHVAAIDILDLLTHDDDHKLARSAEDALLSALHVVIDEPVAGPHLAEILAGFQKDALVRVRVETERLIRIYDKARPDDATTIQRLQSVLESLPQPDRIERIRALAQVQRWEMDDGKLQAELDELITALEADEVDVVVELMDHELPAAWEIGHALARRPMSEDRLADLIRNFDRNPVALSGFLTRRVETGEKEAFDDFLDSEPAKALDARGHVLIAVRGPVTERARSHVFEGLSKIPVANGAFLLFGWQRNLDHQAIARLAADWIPRIATQADYNAAIDWLNLTLHSENAVPQSLLGDVLRLLLMRAQFPAIAQQQWDWARLAQGLVETNAGEIAKVILDGIDPGDEMIHEGDDDARLLMECTRRAPVAVWADIATRLDRGSWRIQMQLGEWFLSAIPTEIVSTWVGDDVRRARRVAPISPVKGSSPPPMTRYLLEKFGKDDKIASSLYGNFMGGVWMGPDSARLADQIEQLNGWRRDTRLPLSVREWAAEVIDHLERRIVIAREREAEEQI
jgi:hypothetical protein